MSRSRNPWKIPATEEGDRKRVQVAAERSAKVLASPMAQYQNTPELGMSQQFNLVLSKDGSAAPRVTDHRYLDLAERVEDVTLTITALRPFTLGSDPIHGPMVARSLLRMAPSSINNEAINQLTVFWNHPPSDGVGRIYAQHRDGNNLLPEDGMSVREVAEAFIYDKLLKVGDTSQSLDHIDEAMQHWCVARYIGDIIAIVARQEYLIHLVAPEICPEPTKWAGDPETIYRRIFTKAELKQQRKTRA